MHIHRSVSISMYVYNSDDMVHQTLGVSVVVGQPGALWWIVAAEDCFFRKSYSDPALCSIVVCSLQDHDGLEGIFTGILQD